MGNGATHTRLSPTKAVMQYRLSALEQQVRALQEQVRAVRESIVDLGARGLITEQLLLHKFGVTAADIAEASVAAAALAQK